MFTIRIKTVKTDEFTVKIRATDKVVDLKAKIQAHTEILVEKQILLFRGVELSNADTISKYPIVEGSVLDLMPALE